jgi:putative hydrolase of the HAD superfamily
MKAIVFDFGNVLGFFDYRLTLGRLAAYTDLSADEIEAAAYDKALEDDYESGRITSADFLGQLRQACKLRCDDTVLAEAFADIFRANEALCALVPTLKPRYRLLLGSNTNDLHASWYRRQFAETLKHFDHLVLSHEIGVRKPRPEFFEHCRRLAGFPAGDCLFIDDLSANVAAARAGGWHAILYTDFPDLRGRLQELGISCS